MPVLLLIVLVAPLVLWFLQKPRPLNVLIIDKTVSNTTYREHKGLVWLLNHHKFVHSTEARPYNVARDYVGFVPLPDRKYQIRPVPWDLSSYDLIYLADTYGVYDDDFEARKALGRRSRLIYGGLGMNEVGSIERGLNGGATVIAEFNTFASPTEQPEREALTQLFGMSWSGWIGRWFSNLRRNLEIPEWILVSYRRQYGKEWDFDGPGFVFVHENGRLVVLREGIDTGPAALKISFPEEERKHYGVRNNIYYLYWFDIVMPRPGTTVVATYHLDLMPSGRAILKKAGIPEFFPAVLRRRQDGHLSYYFAGDYVDCSQIPGLWKYRGLDFIQQSLSLDTKISATSFFWKVYAPMMKTILSEIPHRN